MNISFTLNGRQMAIETDPRRRLIEVLREDFQLTGTKDGCSHGDCGTCCVIMDGEAVLACLAQMRRVQGRRITTIEGLGTPTQPHPIQQAFVEVGAVQCGFCSPGMILRTQVLLDAHPNPTRQEITEALSSHLCRCTGYAKIFEAVERAAALLRGEAVETTVAPVQGIGSRTPVLDAMDKATGIVKYAADLEREGMLYAKVLRSSHPYARLVGIDSREAAGLAGVEAVFTARDVPGKNLIIRMVPDQPILAEDTVRHRGEAVAVVAATSLAVAKKAVSLIEVNYEPLEPVGDPFYALQDGSPRLHEKGNLLCSRRIVKGDVEKGFAQADVIVENTYTTPFVEHAYLEPEAGLSYIDEEGRITVCVPSQNPHDAQKEIAVFLGIDKGRVRVIQTPIGGGFGGKIDFTIQFMLALITEKLKKPAKMVYTREESFEASYKRHPFHMTYRTGATREGRLTALEARIVADTGAYASHGPGVLECAAVHGTGPYYIPNVLIDGKAVYTNNPYCGAMRGFGVPQVSFAMESQMDILAHKLGMDPLELRLLNALDKGLATGTGAVMGDGVGVKKTLETVKSHFVQARKAVERERDPSSAIQRGVGLATIWFGMGKGGVPNPSLSHAELGRDGKVYVYTGAADVGQGTWTLMALIASEELGVPLESIVLVSPDTALTGDAQGTCASRQTYVSGNSMRLAAFSLKRALLKVASRAMETDEKDLQLSGGYVISRKDASGRLSFVELAALSAEAGVPLKHEGLFDHAVTKLDPVTGQGVPYQAYGYGTQMVEVEVNRHTGEVRVVRVVAAHDVGRAINPLAVEGQIEGGLLMGLGYGLKEEFLPNQTRTFADYHIPTIADMPEILPLIVEVPEPSGPYGAKGLGELPLFATAPAIANAIYDACGVRITDLPATPQRVLGALKSG